MKLFSLVIIAAMISGCAEMPKTPLSPRMAFPEEEYLRLNKAGTSVVKGQAFLKTEAGDVKTAAGNKVYLNPVTSYSVSWYQHVIVQGKPMEPSDPRLNSYVRTQTADGSGRFSFKNVPAGEYFITTSVTWEAVTGYQGSIAASGGSKSRLMQGGLVTKRIKVADGEEMDEIVTR